ncbi:MAG: mechanosensitive ion channel [Lentisphaerae bacterium]|nr:mechanosensitive ion channel [Lentisphaerota bacterium]
MNTNALIIGTGLLLASILLLGVILLFRKKTQVGYLQGIKGKMVKYALPLGSLIFAVIGMAILPYLMINEAVGGRLAQIFKMWTIGSAGYLGIIAVQICKEASLQRYDIAASDNLEARRMYTQIGVMQGIINVGIVLITVSCIIMTFPTLRQIGVSLLASAGVMGIVLGFAAQKTLGNLIAGIQIATTQPIRIDDVLVVEGEWGWVEEITLTYVVVRIWDLRRLILPISYFTENPFQNWTRTSADILGSVFIYADYTVPVEEMRNELTRILESSPHWDKKVDVLQVTNATEKTIEIRALMSAKDSPTAWQLRCEVREKLLLYLQKYYPETLPKLRLEMEQDKA